MTITLRAGTKLRVVGVWVTLAFDTVVEVAEQDAAQLKRLSAPPRDPDSGGAPRKV